jgi:hypothetical protein
MVPIVAGRSASNLLDEPAKPEEFDTAKQKQLL